jgi:hypothetical protein
VSLVEGLARLAADLGHGVYRVGEVYRPDDIAITLGGVIPEPEQLLAITVYPGGPEPDSRLPFTEPLVQWRVRGTADEAVSRTRAHALFDDLHGRGPVVLPNGVLALSIIAVQPDPIPLGRDDAGRHEHAVNTRVEYHAPSVLRPAL